ncbi:unnamed protein product, partial [Polarella glacialis]
KNILCCGSSAMEGDASPVVPLRGRLRRLRRQVCEDSDEEGATAVVRQPRDPELRQEPPCHALQLQQQQQQQQQKQKAKSNSKKQQKQQQQRQQQQEEQQEEQQQQRQQRQQQQQPKKQQQQQQQQKQPKKQKQQQQQQRQQQQQQQQQQHQEHQQQQEHQQSRTSRTSTTQQQQQQQHQEHQQAATGKRLQRSLDASSPEPSPPPQRLRRAAIQEPPAQRRPQRAAAKKAAQLWQKRPARSDDEASPSDFPAALCAIADADGLSELGLAESDAELSDLSEDLGLQHDEPLPKGRRRQAAAAAAPSTQADCFANSDGEESDDQALSRSVAFAANGGAAAVRSGRKRNATEIGSDCDPEIAGWRRDLEDRWSEAAEPRPVAAFSKELCEPEVVRKLPAENFLAGLPIFDDAGKVCIPLLLGAHKKLLADSNAGSGCSASADARHVGWLARQARVLGLFDDRELKNGCLGRCSKAAVAANSRNRISPNVLIAEHQVRFPVRQAAKKKTTAASGGAESQSQEVAQSADGGSKETLFSVDENAQDEAERLWRRKQAMAALKSRSDLRKDQIGARSSHDLDMRQVTSAIFAPSLSFDLSERGEDDEPGSGEELEVSFPADSSHRNSRRSLLQAQLQKSLRTAMAKGLVPEPARGFVAAPPAAALALPTIEEGVDDVAPESVSGPSEAVAFLPPGDVSAMPSAGVADLELEFEHAPEVLCQPPKEDDQDDFLPSRRRSKRRVVVEDEDVEEGSDAKEAQASTMQLPGEVSSIPTKGESFQNVMMPTQGTPPKAVKRKQARLEDVFFASKALEVPNEEATQAAAAAVAAQPRPLKRLRPGRFEEPEAELPQEELQQEEEEEEEDCLEEEEAEEDVCEAAPAHEADDDTYEADSQCSRESEDSVEDDEDVYRRRKGFLLRKRQEEQSRKRRLQWELDDVEELRDASDIAAHLGTSTMTTEDRLLWKKRIIDGQRRRSGLAPGATGREPRAGAAQGQGGVARNPASRQLIGARADDDSSHLYGLVGSAGSRRGTPRLLSAVQCRVVPSGPDPASLPGTEKAVPRQSFVQVSTEGDSRFVQVLRRC